MKKLIKEQKAIIMADLVASLIIFTIFVGIVVTLMTKTYEQNAQVKLRSQAMEYAAIVLEKVDEKSYSEVIENPNSLIEGMQIDNSVFNVNIKVSDVPNITSKANNIMKIVNIIVKYTSSGETQSLNFSKLKIKENV